VLINPDSNVNIVGGLDLLEVNVSDSMRIAIEPRGDSTRTLSPRRAKHCGNSTASGLYATKNGYRRAENQADQERPEGILLLPLCPLQHARSPAHPSN
jgi:hypothetical protein